MLVALTMGREEMPPDCHGIEACHDAAPIHEQLARLHAGVLVLAAGHETLAGQMAEVTVTLKRHEDQLRDLSGLPAAVAENTTVTRDVLAAVAETRDMVQFARDAQAAGRIGRRIARGGAKLVLTLAGLISAVAGAWWAIKGKL